MRLSCHIVKYYIKQETTVFDHISKHREDICSWNYDTQESFFWRTLRCLEVWSNTVLSVSPNKEFWLADQTNINEKFICEEKSTVNVSQTDTVIRQLNWTLTETQRSNVLPQYRDRCNPSSYAARGQVCSLQLRYSTHICLFRSARAENLWTRSWAQ